MKEVLGEIERTCGCQCFFSFRTIMKTMMSL
jgi:hypothetical protein